IADIAGTIVARRDEHARVSSAKSLIGQVGAIARRLATEAGVQWSQVTHATLGSPGVFDPAHGYVAMAPNLPGWGRTGLVQAVRATPRPGDAARSRKRPPPRGSCVPHAAWACALR